MSPARIHRFAWHHLALKAGVIGGKAMRDGEACVCVASCDEVLGMVAEALTIEALAVKLEHPVPELGWLTGRIKQGNVNKTGKSHPEQMQM